MRNLINAAHVRRAFGTTWPFQDTREHMQVKNSIHVIFVARILVRALICLFTSEVIQARNHTFVVSVISALVEVPT